MYSVRGAPAGSAPSRCQPWLAGSTPPTRAPRAPSASQGGGRQTPRGGFFSPGRCRLLAQAALLGPSLSPSEEGVQGETFEREEDQPAQVSSRRAKRCSQSSATALVRSYPFRAALPCCIAGLRARASSCGVPGGAPFAGDVAPIS